MPALINSVVRDAQPVQNVAGGNNILYTLFCYNQPVAIVEVKSITTTIHGVIWPSPSSFCFMLALPFFACTLVEAWVHRDGYFFGFYFPLGYSVPYLQ